MQFDLGIPKLFLKKFYDENYRFYSGKTGARVIFLIFQFKLKRARSLSLVFEEIQKCFNIQK